NASPYHTYYEHLSFLLALRQASTPSLLPYTTLFRSSHRRHTSCRPSSALLRQGPCHMWQCRRGAVRHHRNLHVSAILRISHSGYRRCSMSVCVCPQDRKSTRLNSSHVSISYAVFCLKKKTRTKHTTHAD